MCSIQARRSRSTAADALADRTTCPLGNHGMIYWGNDLDVAIADAELLETLCKQDVLARNLGDRKF